jgi:hypothetical protein
MLKRSRAQCVLQLEAKAGKNGADRSWCADSSPRPSGRDWKGIGRVALKGYKVR